MTITESASGLELGPATRKQLDLPLQPGARPTAHRPTGWQRRLLGQRSLGAALVAGAVLIAGCSRSSAAGTTSAGTATPIPSVGPTTTAPATSVAPTSSAAPAGPASGQAGSPSPVGPAGYLDDRSTAVAVIQSSFNAINRREFARAYSYWRQVAGQPSLPPFPQFAQGYADTQSVDLATGPVRSNAGAGQLYYSVPVTLVVRMTDGTSQTFVGCYALHLAQPAIQATPPYQPMVIESATVQQVANDADTAALMGQICH